MITNQVMIREHEGFSQRTKDFYFNATFLLQYWNKNNPKKVKQLSQFNLLSSTTEYIEQLKREGIDNVIITSRGKGGGTWMHPKLFIDFAMWISVEFKSVVIDYVLDGLIQSRHNAGDYYNEMTATILNRYVEYYGHKPNPTIYIIEANNIKDLVGVKDLERNEMTQKQLDNITVLQKYNSNLIKKGVGKDSRHKRLKELAESL